MSGSFHPERRHRATHAAITGRDVEIARVERLLITLDLNQAERRRLQLRLKGLRANRQSWLDYQAKGSPRVKGARP